MHYLLTLQVEQKWQLKHFFGPIEPQKFDFSYKPMRMPIIALRGLETAKKKLFLLAFSRVK